MFHLLFRILYLDNFMFIITYKVLDQNYQNQPSTKFSKKKYNWQSVIKSHNMKICQ